jgi:Polypeptide deformylase
MLAICFNFKRIIVLNPPILPFLNERGESMIIKAKGWYDRILQHEIDHLNGILYINKAQLPTCFNDS